MLLFSFPKVTRLCYIQRDYLWSFTSSPTRLAKVLRENEYGQMGDLLRSI